MGEARRDFLEKITGKYYNEWVISGFESVKRFNNIPILNKLAENLLEEYQIRVHGGQVISLKDAITVLELCENLAILPCECRRMVSEEKYCCLNFGLIPELYEKANPDESIEEISVNKGKRLLTRWNKEGLYHLILWSKAPYATTVCSCAPLYCMGYRGRHLIGSKTSMIKGEYVAKIEVTKCNGCKNCLTRCQFGAILYNMDTKKAYIDMRKCFGCGLCSTGCKQDAVELIDRKLSPVKNRW